MEDRSLFIQWDIGCCFFDDFCNLPSERMIANVYRGMQSAVQRHSDFFVFTH